MNPINSGLTIGASLLLLASMLGDSLRDQGHAQVQLFSLTKLAEALWKQGIDVYSDSNNRLQAGASFVFSKSDPAAAARLVSCLEPGTVQDEAAMAVLHQWALKDSSAALQWAEGFLRAHPPGTRPRGDLESPRADDFLAGSPITGSKRPLERATPLSLDARGFCPAQT